MGSRRRESHVLFLAQRRAPFNFIGWERTIYVIRRNEIRRNGTKVLAGMMATGQNQGNCESGRVLKLKTEIRNLRLDLSPERDFPSILRFRDFGFEVQDSFVFEMSFAGY